MMSDTTGQSEVDPEESRRKAMQQFLELDGLSREEAEKGALIIPKIDRPETLSREEIEFLQHISKKQHERSIEMDKKFLLLREQGLI